GSRFPGKCSAHRAFDFLRKSLGLEKPQLIPSATALRLLDEENVGGSFDSEAENYFNKQSENPILNELNTIAKSYSLALQSTFLVLAKKIF
ncbi:MAG: hypothetical protein IJP95_06385, partial [Bacteroidales bacterium]|nr:hypothetical protein [Bacteroidales bacterium]